jgi:ABC-2 type transport system permease protein
MFPILKKEFNSFFASPIAYLVIGVFLLINGLFLWVFKDDLNILNAGFADLNSFFLMAPWIFLFLIPAITMKSFAEEFNSGTIETLQTKPITDCHIVLGKFLASLLLITVALLPTLTYVYTVIQLGNPIGNLDIGSTVGSYTGLLFLAATYTSIGLFTSTLSKNQIVAFILGVFIMFFFFYGFDAIANLFTNNSYTVQKFGMNEHFKSISRGVIDTRDMLYFISLSIFFLVLTKNQLRNAKKTSTIVVLLIAILLINAIGSSFYKRFDITKDKRYTVTETTKSIVSSLDKRTLIKVYLKGSFPAEFKRLQIETQQFLEELRAINSNINIQFINPDTFREVLIKKGMNPSRLTVEENGILTEAIIFPWAEISHQNNTEIVSLLPNTAVNSQEDQLQNAIENLEFSFASSLKSIRQKNKQKIAIITGNGELQDIYLYSLLKEVSLKYHLAKFTLDSVASNPQKTLKDLTSFDLAIIAKPTERFSDKEKLVLDQFIIHGGKTLWMLDNVQADQDSLLANEEMLTYPRNLNLTDLLFSYGVRVNTHLVKDLYAAKISLATGNIGNQPQFQNLPWFFHPLVNGNQQHAISRNIKPVRLQFATQIDTLKNNIKKTPLLVSSLLTTTIGTPAIVKLKSIAEQADEKVYNKGQQLFAVLLEGNFNSAYKNRIKPFETPLFNPTSKATKMVVISDGDIAKNQLLKGQPFDLSIDKWTQESFGNKDFLINTIDYLLDEDGLINLRNKALNIQLLDKQKAYQERTFWQLFNIVLPLLLLLGFGIVFNFLRKRKYQ